MNLRKCFATNNQCYKNAKPMTVKGIMVHSTGANNPNLKRYVQPDDGLLGVNPNGNHFNTLTPGGRKVCVHAFIGKLKDGSIATYQIMPWNWVAWHSGGGSKGYAYNMGYIGFEICEDGLTDKAYFDKVYQEAVELCIYLCKQYNLDETKIICHSEGHKKGIASNHRDVMHWFPKHGKSMDTFREAVRIGLVKPAKKPVQKPAEPTVKPTANATEYRVRVNITDLNIRTEPSASSKSKGHIVPGVYTIVQEKDGWGKLKSGVGWIKLSYTTKL